MNISIVLGHIATYGLLIFTCCTLFQNINATEMKSHKKGQSDS